MGTYICICIAMHMVEEGPTERLADGKSSPPQECRRDIFCVLRHHMAYDLELMSHMYNKCVYSCYYILFSSAAPR